MNTIQSRWAPIAVFLLPLLTSPGIAQAEPWTSIGASGLIDDDDLALYETDASTTGILFFAANATGVINVKYNVVAVDQFGPIALTGRFRDNGGSARIVLELKRYNISTGITSASLATLDSNSFTPSTSYQTRNACFNHVFDFENYAYFIQAQLTRTDTAGTTALGAIKLGLANCVP
jgi:hypothetical protein